MWILKDLWYGNVPFSERDLQKGGPEHEALRAATAAEERLRKLLDEEQKELLQSYDDAESKMLGICECESFVMGVRFGVKMMLDVLDCA